MRSEQDNTKVMFKPGIPTGVSSKHNQDVYMGHFHKNVPVTVKTI